MINARIFDRISSGICIANKEMRVVLWNARMEEMTGILGQEIAGERLDSFFPHFLKESTTMRLEMAFTGHTPVVFSPLLHRDLFSCPRVECREDLYLETIVTSLMSDDDVVSLLFTVRDVTELNLQIQKFRQMRDKALDEVKLREKAEEELKEANRKLLTLANTDPLTSLLNRRSVEELIHKEFERYERQGTVFSLILGDIDHFKTLNDNYGHDCGDKVLINLSRMMKENLRSLDAISRWGGEEFLILLPGNTLDEAVEVAEKIRLKVAACVCDCEKAELQSTMSFGVSEYREGDTLDGLIKRADLGLYEGKSRGRNCVVVFEGEPDVDE